MSIVYLSLGSNLGDRNHFIDCAICEIDKRIGEVTKVSNRYETEPWGFISENKFINVAVEVKTKLSASETSVIIHKIEDELGRKRDINSTGYEDRVIDIDILMFDNIISNNELSNADTISFPPLVPVITQYVPIYHPLNV